MSERRSSYNTQGLSDLSLGIAAQAIEDMIDARRLLKEAVDELRREMLDTLNEFRCAELKSLLATQSRDLASARRDLVGLWIARQETADAAAVMTIELTLAWKARNGGGTIDPVTGKANKDHTEMVLGVYLASVAELKAARGESAYADIKYREKQAEIEGLAGQLSATKAVLHLTAAELNLLAGPVSAVSGLTKIVDGEV